MRVRPAIGTDCPVLGEIHVAGWRFAYQGLVPADYLAAMEAGKSSGYFLKDLDQGKAIHLVEDDSGFVQGFCVHGPARDQNHSGYREIQALYVQPSSIGQGFGRQLLAGVEALVDPAISPRFLVWTLEKNTRARAFYSRQGYRPDGERKAIESWGLWEIAMVKEAGNAF